MKKIGFLINPIAGMGGRVGLKGTDNGIYRKALALGAKPVSADRARAALKSLSPEIASNILFYTCSGKMGENLLRELNFKFEVVLSVPEETTFKETIKACESFLKNGVDLILFCGGDGTAKDVASVVGDKLPILGIPAGVKMSSSVFAVNPEAVGDLLALDDYEITDGEILDIDEREYRNGNLKVKLFGIARTIKAPNKVQFRKNVFSGSSEEESKEGIARFVIEFMDDETFYILGPGSTVKKICDLLGVEKTLLGVDVLRNRRIIARDVNENGLLKLLDENPFSGFTIIVSPIGSQGFIFGRGNQQISPEVIKRVGVENILIIATPQKLSQTPVLFVDTGDDGVDLMLNGRIRVISGYRITTLRTIGSTVTPPI